MSEQLDGCKFTITNVVKFNEIIVKKYQTCSISKLVVCKGSIAEKEICPFWK